MYIGGTDSKGLHHLVSEVLDNSMDEAVAGFATQIDIEFISEDEISIADNGRGIPIDFHPKFSVLYTQAENFLIKIMQHREGYMG